VIGAPAATRRSRWRLACPTCRAQALHPSPEGGVGCSSCRSHFPLIGDVQFLVSENALGTVESFQQELYDRRSRDHPRALAVRLGSSPNISLTYRRHCRLIRRLDVRLGERVLDIGCSTGTSLTEVCATWGVHGVGIDLSPGSIAIAQEVNPLGLEYYVASAEALPFADREFDHILCFDVLEHTARPEVAIREAYRCLSPGGTALFHVAVSDIRFTVDWWIALFWPEFWAEWMASVGHDYARMLSGPALLRTLRREGFTVRKAERFNVFLQNLFDYHLTIFHRILGLVFQRGVRLGSRRHPLRFSVYHRGVAPVIECLTLPDRLLAGAGIGASMYCLVTKDVVW